MKILALVDSFKGTITSKEIGEVIKEVLTNHQVDFIPISDGGDGFLDTIEAIYQTERLTIESVDAINRKISSYVLTTEKNAYIEVANTIGINKLGVDDLSPFSANTYGVGMQIKKIIELGINDITIGLGGSATNDGGAGMLEALGCKFYDKNNELIGNISPSKFLDISKIDTKEFILKTKDLNITILSDVTNPLLGKNGATFIFAKQKGAKDNELLELDHKMKHYASILSNTFNNNMANKTGAGAAGGLGFAILTAFNSTVKSGIDYILQEIKLSEKQKDYDYIITGEGKIDNQSLNGKVILGISKSIPNNKIILISAINELENNKLKKLGFNNVYSIVPKITSKSESLKNPKKYLIELIKTIFQ